MRPKLTSETESFHNYFIQFYALPLQFEIFKNGVELNHVGIF